MGFYFIRSCRAGALAECILRLSYMDSLTHKLISKCLCEVLLNLLFEILATRKNRNDSGYIANTWLHMMNMAYFAFNLFYYIISSWHEHIIPTLNTIM